MRALERKQNKRILISLIDFITATICAPEHVINNDAILLLRVVPMFSSVEQIDIAFTDYTLHRFKTETILQIMRWLLLFLCDITNTLIDVELMHVYELYIRFNCCINNIEREREKAWCVCLKSLN